MVSLTYADAGVNLSAWHETRKRIGELVKSTFNKRVVGEFGQFGGVFDVSMLKDFERPLLVSSVDSVGTKLKIAFETGVHDTVGEDIVNHCINDILVMGARPLYFLDYLGVGRLAPVVAEQVMVGLTRACKAADCALVGGETAELPGFYNAGEYDLVGCIVGAVDAARIVDGRDIKAGDVLVGLRSNGLHTNGYSLARKIVTEVAGKSYGDTFESAGTTFGADLLRPHRAYTPVLGLIENHLVKGCAHITGGGFQENVDRILPSNCSAVIDTGTWTPDPIFKFLQDMGHVENDEMYRTFNMGIGFVLVAGPAEAEKITADTALADYEPRRIGRIDSGDGTVRLEYGKSGA